MFQCKDIKGLWNPTIETACWRPRTITALSYTNAAVNIITDFLFSIVIPLPMLWTLHVNIRTRVTLMLVLGIGAFACVAASVKVSYLVNYGKTGDFLWDSRNITIWTAVELNVAITAASLACLKPILKKLLANKYGPGSHGMNCKQDSGRGHQYFLPRHGRHTMGDTESQIALHPDCHYLGHVNSTNFTEISSGAKSESKADASLKFPHGGILATTSTDVQFCEREPGDGG